MRKRNQDGTYKNKYQHDVSFFKKSGTSYYWARFIAADGNVDDRRLSIKLAKKDYQHLLKFKKAINFTGYIKSYTTFLDNREYQYKDLTICSAHIVIKDLKKYFNIIPNKSLILKPPKLYYENDIRNFIRGYIDGDGCIRFNIDKRSKNSSSWKVKILGTYNMLFWIKKNIFQFVDGVHNPGILPRKNIFYIEFGGYQSKLILDWIYKYSKVQNRLDRKYKLYQKVCKFYYNKYVDMAVL